MPDSTGRSGKVGIKWGGSGPGGEACPWCTFAELTRILHWSRGLGGPGGLGGGWGGGGGAGGLGS